MFWGKRCFVYIVSNYTRTTFYIGVTSNLYIRILCHRLGIGGFFTSKYNLKYLVYYEEFDVMLHAIMREKQLKNWHRRWKIELIQSVNPTMRDLFDLIV